VTKPEARSQEPEARSRLYEALADLLRYPEEPSQQELYVQTFEFNPACTLEIGWHLFGENYERGEFLVRMREQLRRYGIAETAELPDHLTHLLPLIGRMDRAEAAQLACESVLPALAKLQLPEGSPYAAALANIRQQLESEFGPAKSLPQQFPIFQEAACE
jgi:nitrate reductase delta subunit